MASRPDADHRGSPSPCRTSYPQTGDLPAETVTTSYNDQGLPAGLTSSIPGAGTYVAGTGYTYAGRLASRTLDTGTSSPTAGTLTRPYSWDNSTGNLAQSTTTTENQGQGKEEFQDDLYAYDPAGNLLSDQDKTGGQWQCYGYDHFPRLTQAWMSRRAIRPGSVIGSGSGCRGAAAWRARWGRCSL
jgi:hypothetical protein